MQRHLYGADPAQLSMRAMKMIRGGRAGLQGIVQAGMTEKPLLRTALTTPPWRLPGTSKRERCCGRDFTSENELDQAIKHSIRDDNTGRAQRDLRVLPPIRM